MVQQTEEETFNLMFLMLKNHLEPVSIQIDENNVISQNWYVKCLSNSTHDNYIINCDHEMKRFVLITCKNKENPEVFEEGWVEIIDIVPVESNENNTYTLRYGVPETYGEESVPLIMDADKGASCSIGILFGYN